MASEDVTVRDVYAYEAGVREGRRWAAAWKRAAKFERMAGKSHLAVAARMVGEAGGQQRRAEIAEAQLIEARAALAAAAERERALVGALTWAVEALDAARRDGCPIMAEWEEWCDAVARPALAGAGTAGEPEPAEGGRGAE